MFRALAATFLLLPIACTASSRMADAVVTERDGQPCFALSDQPINRVNAAIVDDLSTVPPTSIWVVDIDHESGKLLAGCVVYGQVFPNQKAGHVPATTLRIGHIYEVGLMAERIDPTDPTQGYVARFCLAPQPGNAKPRVRQIVWNKQAGRWGDEVCGLQQREKP